ncbi:hypothetical protein ASE16_03480 [Leifsonia sp. Root227]|nr:hypothetical protein ASE16_03480 [Leifsonia sp. Root227]
MDASGNVYIYQSGWQLSGGVPIAGTITPNGSAWSLGTGSSLTKQGKLVTIDAQFLKTSAINSNDVVGTLPAGFRPSRQIVRVGASTTGGSTGFVYYTINTNGQIVASYVNVTGTTSIWLGGITWSI